MVGKQSGRESARERLIYPIAGAVTAMWLLSGVVALYTGESVVFMATTTLMGAVVGFVLGIGLVKSNGGVTLKKGG